ncbi:energy transducer TonB [Photobacterium proteolyticum]|uniref:energy transducer TonB n=1 Tax=Photobacterium proteolyticum TaxID=1903952 RepID=UPI001FE95D1C|nr:energy transducer TonB [Photobacterium proteolyticum]
MAQEAVQKTTPVSEPMPVVKETKVKKLVKKKEPEAVKKALAPKPKPKPKPEPEPEPEPKITKPEPKKVSENPVKEVTKKIDKPEPPKKVDEAKPATPKSVAKPKAEMKSEQAAGVNSSPRLVTRPTFATRPSPVKYPKIAKRRGIEGQVMIEVWIDKNGKQIKQTLVQSSGAQVLDKAAIEAIKRWQFSSHTVDGQAIAHRVQIPVRFKLD